MPTAGGVWALSFGIGRGSCHDGPWSGLFIKCDAVSPFAASYRFPEASLSQEVS